VADPAAAAAADLAVDLRGKSKVLSYFVLTKLTSYNFSRIVRPSANQPKRPARPNIRRTHTVDDTELDGNTNTERMTRRQNPNRCYNTRYKGKSLVQVLKQDTVFKNVELAISLLNDTDTSSVAECSVNWYIVKNKGIPSKTCDEYNEVSLLRESFENYLILFTFLI
jgi:hypothetical protein